MKSFFNHHRTRCTAIVMVFVWIMTLSIGIANACVLDPIQSRRSTVAHATEVSHKDADEHTVSPDKSVCLDVCAAEQTVLIKVTPLDVPTALDTTVVLILSALIIPILDQKKSGHFRPNTLQVRTTCIDPLLATHYLIHPLQASLPKLRFWECHLLQLLCHLKWFDRSITPFSLVL